MNIIQRDGYPKTWTTWPVWVLWRLEPRGEKLTKVPYRPNGQKARSNDVTTWSSFDHVMQEYKQHPDTWQGIGAMMEPAQRMAFVDLDHHLIDGQPDAFAQDILDAFPDAFVETSQSGTGLHIFVQGQVPQALKNSTLGIQVYGSGRFCASTGNRVSVSDDVVEGQAGLDYVVRRYATKSKQLRRDLPPTRHPSAMDDREIIDRAARTMLSFRALWVGDYEAAGYGSHSEADAALCTALGFWTNRDPEAVDRIFRCSGLYRAKWERKDYRERTIAGALAALSEDLAEWKARKRDEQRIAEEEELRDWFAD